MKAADLTISPVHRAAIGIVAPDKVDKIHLIFQMIRNNIDLISCFLFSHFANEKRAFLFDFHVWFVSGKIRIQNSPHHLSW